MENFDPGLVALLGGVGLTVLIWVLRSLGVAPTGEGARRIVGVLSVAVAFYALYSTGGLNLPSLVTGGDLASQGQGIANFIGGAMASVVLVFQASTKFYDYVWSKLLERFG